MRARRIGAGGNRDAPRLAVLDRFRDARARRRRVRRRSVAYPQRARTRGARSRSKRGIARRSSSCRNGQPTSAISAPPTSIPRFRNRFSSPRTRFRPIVGWSRFRRNPSCIPELPGREHDEILARGSGRMTIMIPRGTAMVMAQQRAGHLTIENYHGIFVAHARGGRDFAR